MNRILIAALLGGSTMFLAGTFTHVVLPIGEAGIKQLPNEEPVLAALRSSVTEPGLYFFPGMPSGAAGEAQKKQWEERMRQGPTGIMVYQTKGSAAMEPSQLAGEFISNVLVALVAALLLAQVRLSSFGGRVGFVTALGGVAWLAISVSLWNWYRFPATYTLAELVHELFGFAMTGLVLAWRIKP